MGSRAGVFFFLPRRANPKRQKKRWLPLFFPGALKARGIAASLFSSDRVRWRRHWSSFFFVSRVAGRFFFSLLLCVGKRGPPFRLFSRAADAKPPLSPPCFRRRHLCFSFFPYGSSRGPRFPSRPLSSLAIARLRSGSAHSPSLPGRRGGGASSLSQRSLLFLFFLSKR